MEWTSFHQLLVKSVSNELVETGYTRPTAVKSDTERKRCDVVKKINLTRTMAT